MLSIDDKEILMELAKRVKSIREGKKLTQEDAYNDTGIHFARIEQGKRNINYLTLVKICRYFDISMSDFLK